jgi:hypothetical protein
MTGRFKALQTEVSRLEAALDARVWGYPRSITFDEIEYGAWYGWGDVLVFWLHRGGGKPEDDVYVHLAVDPEVRKRWPVRRVGIVIEALAELHGGHRLRFMPGDGFDEMAGYLKRIGWREVDGDLVSELGRGETWATRKLQSV